MTFLLTQPGIPLMYYGDEIGMRYIPGSPEVEGSRDRSRTRTPTQWNGAENAGFSTAPVNKSYIPQDPDPQRPTVAAQQADPTSQLNFIRGLLKLRTTSDALGNKGACEFLSDTTGPATDTIDLPPVSAAIYREL